MKEKGEKRKDKNRFSLFVQKMNRLLTKRNQCVVFLFTIVVCAAAIFDAVYGYFPEPISITLYTFAAGGFFLSCTLWVKAILFFVSAVLLPFAKSNKITNTLIEDSRLRTVVTTLPGMGLNLIWAVFNGVIGAINRSAWYGSLFVYYLLLCIMRLLSVSYARQLYTKRGKNSSLKIRELKVYRNCGLMLSASSIALGGAVIMLVHGEGGKSYPGLMIYAAATYTFYKLIMSIVGMVKARKEKTILLITLRNIGYADSLVSLLSLQTALFAAFGQGEGDYIFIQNVLTGAGVCLMILGLGIYMVYNAKKVEKRIRAAIEET